MYHPDVNRSPEAVQQMQQLNHAYSVLRDPMQRAQYDQTLYAESTRAQSKPAQTATASDSPSRSNAAANPRNGAASRADEVYIPTCCQKCGNSDATLRFAAFPYVVSVVILTFRRAWGGLYCERCRIQETFKGKMITLFFGWWGIPFGPIYSLGVLFGQGDGKVPPDINASYLAQLGIHFLQHDDPVQAQEAWNASYYYYPDPKLRNLYHEVFGSAPTEPAEVSGSSAGMWLVLGLVLAIVAAVFWIAPGVQNWLPSASYRAPVAVQRRSAPTATQNRSVPTRAPVGQVAQATPAPTATPPVIGVVTQMFASLHEFPDGHGRLVDRPRKGTEFAVLGQQRHCEWLQVVTDDGKQGWINTELGAVQWDGNCDEIPLGVFRPESGVLVETFPVEGLGELTIENGAGDVVVVLTTLDRSRQQTTYVRNGETITTDGIPDGVYEVFYKTGVDWNGREFTQQWDASKFEDPFQYGPRPGRWTITPYSVVDGNAEISTVDQDEFPPIAVE